MSALSLFSMSKEERRSGVCERAKLETQFFGGQKVDIGAEAESRSFWQIAGSSDNSDMRLISERVSRRGNKRFRRHSPFAIGEDELSKLEIAQHNSLLMTRFDHFAHLTKQPTSFVFT
jgi:hypothetical protein